MKSLSITTCVALMLCTACTKIIDKPVSSQSFTAKVSQGATIENLGTAITGVNILWKINPIYEGIEPLFTTLPYSNSGFSVLMIDNGNRGTDPLKFISVNLQTKTSKTIQVVDKNGVVVKACLGRVIRSMFGMNKKYYVATENGGHLIEYDPYTEKATDLGQPFTIDGLVYDIYSLNVGKDGALYGGSFGGNGDVYTFRYDYSSFAVDKNSLDENSRYVTYVTGDEKYTYASCGQNTWKMYSIERATGKKTLLLNTTNPAERIFPTSNIDACYAQFNGLHFKLNGTTATVLSSLEKPGPRMEYLPYQPNNPQLPKVQWSESDRKLYYQFAGAAELSIKVENLNEEVYATSAMTAIGNKLFITGGTIPRAVSYQDGNGFSSLGGTNISIFTMAAIPGTNEKKIVMGGYPKGALLEYDANKNWNLGLQTLSTTPPDIFSQESNPKKFVQFQDADYSGVFGPMTINGILYTKDGTLVAAGNNDRLTESASRELGIGTYKNGTKKNFTTAEMRNYEFQSMCYSKDSTEIFISGVAKYANEGRIFRYNPGANSITSAAFHEDKNPGNIQYYKDNLLAGVYNDVVYLMDINTHAIVWKTVLGNGQRITAFTVAPDGNIWIAYNYLNAFTSKLVKMEVDTDNLNAITFNAAEVSVIKSPDVEEGTKPLGLVFMKTAQSNVYDLYVAGYKAVCRIRNAITLN